ncbi:Mu transposase C-terminal domain-containing protein [Neisseria musculi]|uniref:Mu transposase C-terminal family protein n=1 Tax=Neisseria musculi TaxID=1815583 RepID=A0A7H1M9P4_9NEIS|nr:Mu transposase C-terminal domain-containing protein [Neisseria musculi]QNT58359.1 mu transposase, C-terminal family protein [Neisseria musculi]
MRVKTDVLSPLELDMMYRPEEERIPDRGVLNLWNNTYFNEALLDYSGQKVRVAYDIHNAESVIVKDMQGKVICKAVFNGNKRAAFAETRMEQLADRRRKGQARRLQNKMDLIEAQRRSATRLSNSSRITASF